MWHNSSICRTTGFLSLSSTQASLVIVSIIEIITTCNFGSSNKFFKWRQQKDAGFLVTIVCWTPGLLFSLDLLPGKQISNICLPEYLLVSSCCVAKYPRVVIKIYSTKICFTYFKCLLQFISSLGESLFLS